MKFLCIDCDEVMGFEERQLPGDGTMAAVFACPGCEREIAMLANAMETQLVSSMGVKVGGRAVPEQPLELVRGGVEGGRDDAFDDADPVDVATGPLAGRGDGDGESTTGAADDAGATARGGRPTGRVEWSDDAIARLGNVPSFVRGMVKRIYTDYARERGIDRITPRVMDRARSDLGLEGM
ncbi:MAG: PCP reductase family protein [Gemmatimonadota bacterium]